MKRMLLSALLGLPLLLHATTISELFDALKNHPQTEADEVMIRQAQIGKTKAYAKLYPDLNLFASYDHYNTPTGMVPVPPNKLLPMVKNTSVPQPFSKDIGRIGVTIGMPLFVKSIFTYADKAEKLQQSAKAKKRINLLKNEAIIVGADANLRYLEAMQKALRSKRTSLQKTKSFVRLKVNSGRAPKSALFKINDGLSQVNIALNDIAIAKTKAIETIEALTGIHLKHPVSLHLAQGIHEGEIGALEPLRKRVEADRLELRAQREKLYPSLFLKGSYARSYADAYNNDKSVDESYGDIGVMLKMPLYKKSQYAQIDQSKLALRQRELTLKKEELDLQAQANRLKTVVPMLDASVKLYKASVADKQRLLKIAKVAYKNQRMSTEDYLRYEDDLVAQEAKLHEAEAKKWQTLMQLAVIYTNPIEEIVK